MFFEHILSRGWINVSLSDGFEDEESEFYVEKAKDIFIRLRRFVNHFPNKLCIYKLHGSVDQYVYNYQNKEFTTVKVPSGSDPRKLVKRIDNPITKTIEQDRCWWNFYPDFLSGKNSKINHYGTEYYYGPLFERFRANLNKSSYLIIIGYGFGDTVINEILSREFLLHKNKSMIIITPTTPSENFLQLNNVTYFGEGIGIENFDFEALLNEIQ